MKLWMWFGLLMNVCCIIFEGFFSGSETAIISIDRIKLRHLVSRGSKGAKQAQAMLQQPERFLGTTLVGTNLSVVLGSVILTTILTQIPRFADRVQLYVVLFLAPLALVFGEIVPKSIFQQHANALVPIVAPILQIPFKVFYPIVFVVSSVATGLLRSIGVEKKQRRQTLTREELKFLIDTDTRGTIVDQQSKEMMSRVFDFGDMTVKEIMVPLVDVVVIAKGTKIEEAIKKIQQCGFSRIPIYANRVDHLIGVIHAFDLLKSAALEKTIDPFIRKAYYVPETIRLDTLLRNMQRHRTQIAIVVDEYGGSMGIVTLENLLEEIVGEIEDEFDEFETEMYQHLPDGTYRIHARMDIDELNEQLQLNLPEGEFETLGGFLLSEFQRIPFVDETIEYHGFVFKIEEANDRSITWVNVSRL